MARRSIIECAPDKERAVQVCLRRNVSHEPAPTIRGPDDVCRILRGVENADRESFYVLHLSSKGQLNGVEEVARGGLSSVEVTPRELFKSAILSNAAAVVVAHNHPSGDPAPSRDDIEMTKHMREAGSVLGIPVHDHVVIGATRCHSMADHGEAGFAGGKKGYRDP
jgi:DNA repair protein RadC